MHTSHTSTAHACTPALPPCCVFLLHPFCSLCSPASFLSCVFSCILSCPVSSPASCPACVFSRILFCLCLLPHPVLCLLPHPVLCLLTHPVLFCVFSRILSCSASSHASCPVRFFLVCTKVNKCPAVFVVQNYRRDGFTVHRLSSKSFNSFKFSSPWLYQHFSCLL